MTRLHNDTTTGTVTIIPDTEPVERGMKPVTYRVTRRSAAHSPRRDNNRETRATRPRDRGTDEAMLTWQGRNGRPTWGGGLKAKRGAAIASREPDVARQATGTGGNAVRAIPTGPAGYGRPALRRGMVERTVKYAKWDMLLRRCAIAGIDASKIACVRRAMAGALSERGRPTHVTTCRIQVFTESEWKKIDKVRL